MDINNIRSSRQDGTTIGITYGYIRVSTIAQHDERQRIAMAEFGITEDHIFVDKQSGKNFDRPAYMAMMATLQPGDTVVVQSLDRLGRTSLDKPKGYENVLAQWASGAISECEAARRLGVSRPTFHKWSHE